MKTKSLLVLLFITICTIGYAQKSDYSIFDKKFNFYIANDLGRNGYYDQKPIAELMGTMAEEIGPEFVVATGPSMDDKLRINLLASGVNDRLVSCIGKS